MPVTIGDTTITVVGGTALTTNGGGGPWSSETVWNEDNGTKASGSGYASATGVPWPIPYYQQGMNMTGVGGSDSWRNAPDVAIVSTGIYLVYNGIIDPSGAGTSLAAPLWASFTALANEQRAAFGDSSLGFLNSRIYAVGNGSDYNSAFHDITTGSDTTNASPSEFFAAKGFDLCSGWGSPNGAGLINTLTGPVGGTLQSNIALSGILIVTSTITVPSGDTLTIDPGSTLEFASGAGIMADGVLNADGTASQPITFTSTGSTSPGSWGSIIFSGSGANNSTLQYCNIRYGTTIQANNTSNVTIENCNIMNSSSYGIDLSSSSNFLAQSDTIANSNIYDGILIFGGSNNNCYENAVFKYQGGQGIGIVYSASGGNVGGIRCRL